MITDAYIENAVKVYIHFPNEDRLLAAIMRQDLELIATAIGRLSPDALANLNVTFQNASLSPRAEVYPKGSWIRKLALVWLGVLLLIVIAAAGRLVYFLSVMLFHHLLKF